MNPVILIVLFALPLTAAEMKQRSGWVKPEITLQQIAQAFDALEATASSPNTEELKRVDQLVRSAPDALCPQVAELSLKLTREDVWMPLLSQSFAEWALFDGLAAAKRIKTIGDSDRQTAAWHVVVQIWRQRDREGCWRYLTAMPDGVSRDHDMRRFLEELSFRDPKRTLELAAGVTNPVIREEALDEVAWNWAAKDGTAAMKWVNGLTDATQRDRLIRRVVLGVTSKNKEGGAAMAQALPDENLRREMVNNVHRVWANHNVQAAVAAFVQLPPALQDVRTASHFGFCTEKVNMLEILQLADQLATVEGAHEVFLASAASRKENQGRMEDSITLLDKLPPGSTRNQGIRQLATKWGAKDSMDASAWLKELPEGPEREVAIEGLAWGLLPSQPEQSIEWAERLQAPDARANLRVNLYANWSKKNEAKARAWLDANRSLSEAEKQKCLKQAELMKTLSNGYN